VAIAHYFARDYEAAEDAARRVIRLYPDFPLIYRWLAAALGQAGRADEARDALNKAIAIGSGSFDMYVRARVPWHRAEDYEHMLEGLRKAGWREE
jgi:adenylate cyclase